MKTTCACGIRSGVWQGRYARCRARDAAAAAAFGDGIDLAASSSPEPVDVDRNLRGASVRVPERVRA